MPITRARSDCFSSVMAASSSACGSARTEHKRSVAEAERLEVELVLAVPLDLEASQAHLGPQAVCLDHNGSETELGLTADQLEASRPSLVLEHQ